MPNVNVLKKEFEQAIGREFATDDEFEELCFEFGVECEFGNADEQQMNRVDDKGNAIDIKEEMVYKIEVAANRYDLLCVEGLGDAFKAYLGKCQYPRYQIKNSSEALLEIIVEKETQEVRPYVVGAVLRNVNFTTASYNSFIDLQDKLHQNICLRRKLASMGTHDLDKINGQIRYKAMKPEDIHFKALKQTEEMNAAELVELYKNDMVMKKFVPYLENAERYPVFTDDDGVLSLPPLINSDRSKISLETKNIFIEVTATDHQKAKICLAVLAAQFSGHSEGEWKHNVEQVKITHVDAPELNAVSPTLTYVDFDVEIAYINSRLGINLNAEQVGECATKMGLVVKGSNDKTVTFEVPPTRCDVLHPCDIVEDIGIGYGYNNVPRVFPPTNTVGRFQPNNKFQDLLRAELAQAGYIECLTMSLVSKKDNYHNLRLQVDETECVTVGNPKSVDFEAVRTSLLPGLLKTLKENTNQSLPQKIFEISDCCVLDGETDTGARNVRKISALSLDQASNFEVIHGLLDMMMLKCGVDMEKGNNYKLVADEENRRFFPQNGASVMLNNKKIGMVGVLHPEILSNFDLKYPVSAFEIDFDAVFSQFITSQE